MVFLQNRTQRQTCVHMRQWVFSRLTHCIMEILNFKTTERVSSRPRKELMLQDMSRGSQLEHKGKESAVVKPLFIIYALLMLFCCAVFPCPSGSMVTVAWVSLGVEAISSYYRATLPFQGSWTHRNPVHIHLPFFSPSSVSLSTELYYFCQSLITEGLSII